MSEMYDRYKQATVIYAEDECAPDAESLEHAYVRLFGEPLPNSESAISFEDFGDCLLFEFSARGRFVRVGPPRGGMTDIRVLNSTKRSA